MFKIKSRSSRLIRIHRKFATRSEFERPKGFDINFKPYRPPFFSWKVIFGFAAAGSYLAYSEILFEKYAQFTECDQSELLPIQLEFKLKSLPIYQKLTKTLHGDDWVMMKSYENLDRNVLDITSESGAYVKMSKSGEPVVKSEAEYASQTLTSHTLAHPGGIAIPPVIFHNRKTSETVTIVHMGYRLCGYPFLIHGGMLATLLNETFKRNASLRHDASGFLKDDYKVENISITYRKPALADQFFIVKTQQVANQEPCPSNARLPTQYKSTIEAENGKILVESYASLTNTGRASNRMTQDRASRWALF